MLGNGAELGIVEAMVELSDPDGLAIVRLVVPVVTAGGEATDDDAELADDWVVKDNKVDVIVTAVPVPMLTIVTTPLLLDTGEKLGRE